MELHDSTLSVDCCDHSNAAEGSDLLLDGDFLLLGHPSLRLGLRSGEDRLIYKKYFFLGLIDNIDHEREHRKLSLYYMRLLFVSQLAIESDWPDLDLTLLI